jgi:hypothetical protein
VAFPGAAGTPEQVQEFVFERHLEDFMAKNFDAIFEGKLKLCHDPAQNEPGQQYETGEVGRIDLLAQSMDEKEFVVIELKKGLPSELGCKDLSRARRRRRYGPKRYVLFSQRLSGDLPIHAHDRLRRKGKAETVEKQVARELERGRYCSLRTTVRGRPSTQDIAIFIYRDFAADLFGCGVVVVGFDIGGELAKEFADAWFQKVDAFMNETSF